jgi:hypothetical protein
MKTTIELRKFETSFEKNDREHFTKTKLTYTTPIGNAQITVSANDITMSTGNFHLVDYCIAPGKITDKQFTKITDTVRNDALYFVERLRGLLNG